MRNVMVVARVLVMASPLVLTGLACTEDAPPMDTVLADGGSSLDSGSPLTSDSSTMRDASTAVDADAAVELTTTLPISTGLDANRTVLADQAIDHHWTVKDALGTALTAYVQTEAFGYPGLWLAPSATSKFISPFINTVDTTEAGMFTYKTTFSLRKDIDLGSVELTIRYAADNEVSSILLNGQALAGVVASGYTTFETVTVTTGFVIGTNTVELMTANAEGPTGLRAELDLTAN